MRTKRSLLLSSVLSVLLVACGGADDVVNGPDDDEDEETTSTSTSSSETTSTTEDEDEFSWNLPVGDTSISLNEAVLYGRLQRGECAEAQAFLDETWRTLTSPRNVLLYQAGVHFCAGRKDQGTAAFQRAEARFGWAGVDQPPLDCNVYKAAKSVIGQQPQESVTCSGGQDPTWPDDNPETPRDDPRTDTDESQETTTTSSTTTSSSSTTTTTEP